MFVSCKTQSHLDSISKSEIKNSIETSKFRIDTKGAEFAEIEIRINQNWQIFSIIEEPLGSFEFECQEVEMNGIGSKELILKWSNSVYGSGGGTVTKGLQIWNLDNATKLLNEITYCSEESFGRDGNPYININEKKFEIKKSNIKVYKEKLVIENYNVMNLSDYCKLSNIKSGTYKLKNGMLKLR